LCPIRLRLQHRWTLQNRRFRVSSGLEQRRKRPLHFSTNSGLVGLVTHHLALAALNSRVVL
jgi:hypothetical protein